MDSFFDVLYANTSSLIGPDKVFWNPSKKGRFQVRLYYNVLRSFSGLSFPWKSILDGQGPT